jgi:hypothetical protein
MQKPPMTWDAVVAARLAAQDQLHQADIAWSAGRFGPDAGRLAADYAAIKAHYEKLTKLSLGLQPAIGFAAGHWLAASKRLRLCSRPLACSQQKTKALQPATFAKIE